MAFQRPQRSEGGSGTGHSSSIALPLGAVGAHLQCFDERVKVEAQRRSSIKALS